MNIRRLDDLRFVAFLEPNVSRAVENGSFHGLAPFRFCVQCTVLAVHDEGVTDHVARAWSHSCVGYLGRFANTSVATGTADITFGQPA
jgi:hypothetical protein